MKRMFELLSQCLRSSSRIAALVALLPASQAATTIGINFSDDWGDGGGTAVTQDAFGVPAANWYNMPRVFNSIAGPSVSSNAVVTLPEGGTLLVEWSCANTYSLTADSPVDGPGINQVIYGYLDDGGVGYQVRVSGFRGSVSGYSLQLIASTDSGSGFADANVVTLTGSNAVQYTDILTPDFAAGAYSVSSTTPEILTLGANNSVTISGPPRDGSLRSTLAGFLISYTAGGSNPPLIESQPVGPTGITYEGSPFTVSALASGSSPLAFQWRLNGNPITGATTATYTKAVSAVSDSGDYDLVVTNSFGAITSSIVNVSITPIFSPIITAPPVSQTFYKTYPANFSVQADGGQLSYQWFKGTTLIDKATNATLTLPSVTSADVGTYTVKLSNSAGSAEASATLTVTEPGPPYATAMAASQPLLYLRLNDTAPIAQATATNRGSLGVAGTGLYVGAYSLLAPGALVGSSDTAVALTAGRAVVEYNEALNPVGSFTVEAWAKPATGTGNRLLVQSMINGQNPDNADDRTGWAFRQSGTNLQFLVGLEFGGAFYQFVTAEGAVTPEVWNHYAATYNSQDLSVSLFVNGVEVTNVVLAEALIPNKAGPVIVGDRGFGGWAFQGSLDEVAIYPSLLTPAQLLAHYQTGTNAATSATYPNLVIAEGAVEYLRLDDAGLPPGANSAVNNGTLGTLWTGTYAGTGSTLGNPLIATGTDGPRPTPFPGLETTNDAVAMTNGWVTSPQLTLGNQVTAIVWLNREPISTTGDLSWPAWLGGGGMHLNNGSANNPDAELRYHWNGGEWGWSSGLFVPANVWTFAALVVEPTQAVMYMSEGTTLQSSTNTVNHAPMVVTSPPGFGGNQPERADRNYIGQLDEVAVFNRALSGEEIAAIFNSAFSTGPVPPSELTLSIVGGEYFLSWTSGALQAAPSLSGTFTDVAGATSPYKMVPSAGLNFYRLRAN